MLLAAAPPTDRPAIGRTAATILSARGQPTDMTDGFDAGEIADEFPEGVDEAAVKRARFVAHLLDDSIRVPGTNFRVGLDPILSVVPISGDLVSGAFSLYIVAEAARLGVPMTTIVEMLANVAVDVGGGSVPVLGTAFDAVWKSNIRNVELLEEHLRSADAPASESVTIDIDEPE